MVSNLFSALLRIISFTKMIVVKWIWICKVHHVCKPIQFLNFQERSRNDNAMFLLTIVLRIQPHLITPSHWVRRDTLRDGSIRVAWEATRARSRERVGKPLEAPRSRTCYRVAFGRVFSWYQYGELSCRLRYLQADQQLKRFVWDFIVNIFGL